MFVGMGLSAVVPVLDGLATHGFDRMKREMGLLWVVLQGALYILGAGLYAVSIARVCGVMKLADMNSSSDGRKAGNQGHSMCSAAVTRYSTSSSSLPRYHIL